MEEDPWESLPLEKGDQWIRVSDGVPVVVAKRLGRQVRYTFPNGGSMVTRIARFSRHYRPASAWNDHHGRHRRQDPDTGV